MFCLPRYYPPRMWFKMHFGLRSVISHVKSLPGSSETNVFLGVCKILIPERVSTKRSRKSFKNTTTKMIQTVTPK